LESEGENIGEKEREGYRGCSSKRSLIRKRREREREREEGRESVAAGKFLSPSLFLFLLSFYLFLPPSL
jgi:hypothetical protein